MSIHAQRTQVRHLLDNSSPADAPTAYYALFHDPARSALYTYGDEAGRVAGFVGVFQTGIDLFRPLITLSCTGPACAAALVHRALTPSRPYLFFANAQQIPYVQDVLALSHVRYLHIYRLDVRRFHPAINVLVRREASHDKTPRSVIASNGMGAVAGVNWQSPSFAEIYVHTDAPARRRGWGSSVVSDVTQAVLESGRTPLYLVEDDNSASQELADTLGYVDTGARQVFADALYDGAE